MLVFWNKPSVRLVANFNTLPLFNWYSKINLVIKIAVNKDVKIPITKVFANPSTGPVPKNHSTKPVNKVVMFASIIEE